MNDLDSICFQIIGTIGEVTNYYYESIDFSKQGNFIKAQESLNLGSAEYVNAHRIHASLIQRMASGEKIETSLLLIHAEDQLMNTEMLRTLVEQVLCLYKEIKEIKDLIVN